MRLSVIVYLSVHSDWLVFDGPRSVVDFGRAHEPARAFAVTSGDQAQLIA